VRHDDGGRLGAPALVSLAGVSKAFDAGPPVLRDIDLRIEEGAFVGLLGPSGCGKSTLLRLIAGLLPVTEGSIIRAPGIDAAGGIGYVFQDPTLLPWSTVADNVWLPLRLQGHARRDVIGRIEDALALVGLADVSHARPRQLSGGMRMRVSIARALVTRPKLLLLDEPFAALDELTRSRLNDDLHALWRDERLTVAFVTHNVAEAVFLSTRVATMAARPGRIHSERTIELPLERPSTLRTTPHFLGVCREVSEQLVAAMAA
jgi:ABC-type nitrate/sulfonate/bicarbonate transport system, ATPase component